MRRQHKEKVVSRRTATLVHACVLDCGGSDAALSEAACRLAVPPLNSHLTRLSTSPRWPGASPRPSPPSHFPRFNTPDSTLCQPYQGYGRCCQPLPAFPRTKITSLDQAKKPQIIGQICKKNTLINTVILPAKNHAILCTNQACNRVVAVRRQTAAYFFLFSAIGRFSSESRYAIVTGCSHPVATNVTG